MQVSNSTTQSSESGKTNSDDAWTANAKKKLLDLSTSNDDVIKFIQQAYSGSESGASSPARQQVLQYLIGVRSEMASSLSNMLRRISETTQNIIANIR